MLVYIILPYTMAQISYCMASCSCLTANIGTRNHTITNTCSYAFRRFNTVWWWVSASSSAIYTTKRFACSQHIVLVLIWLFKFHRFYLVPLVSLRFWIWRFSLHPATYDWSSSSSEIEVSSWRFSYYLDSYLEPLGTTTNHWEPLRSTAWEPL